MRATKIGYLFFNVLLTDGALLATYRNDATEFLRILWTTPFQLAGVWLCSWRFFATRTASFKTPA